MAENFSNGFQNMISNHLSVEICVCTHVSHLKTHAEVQHYEEKSHETMPIIFRSLLEQFLFNSAGFHYRDTQATTQVLRMLPYKPL